MPETPSLDDTLVEFLVNEAARSTLPFAEAVWNRGHGTAFWYNHLISDTGDREVFAQYLVTAEALTRCEAAEWRLRVEVCGPEMSAEHLMMMDFADAWIRFRDIGVAVMPTGGLYGHAERKGWSWHTDEIREGLAASAEDVATIGIRPVRAHLLGHDVDAEGDRPQIVVEGAVARDAHGLVRWVPPLPQGCVGAPVFIWLPLEDRQFKLVCLGAVLPGDEQRIATFDRIRAAVARVAAEKPRRRWWRPGRH